MHGRDFLYVMEGLISLYGEHPGEFVLRSGPPVYLGEIMIAVDTWMPDESVALKGMTFAIARERVKILCKDGERFAYVVKGKPILYGEEALPLNWR